jgi:hypothetical protein
MERSIRIARRCYSVCLIVSVLLLLWFLLTAAETQSGHITAREVQEITDVHKLQVHATVLASGARRASGYAMFMCWLALVSFLISIVCTVLILIQLRRIESGPLGDTNAA